MSSPSLRSSDLARFYLANAPSPVALVDELMREHSGPSEESSSLVKHESPHERQVDKSDIAPPSV